MRSFLQKFLAASLFICAASSAYSQGFTHEESFRKIPLSHVLDISKSEPSTFVSELPDIPEPGGERNTTNAIKAKLRDRPFTLTTLRESITKILGQ